MNDPTDMFHDALQAAKTRVLAIHGTNYLQAILPEIVAISRTYERILERSWPHAYKCRWQELQQTCPANSFQFEADRLAAAYWEILNSSVIRD